MDKDQAKRLGALIKTKREAAGLSLRGLDRRTGIDNALISKMESGLILEPSPDKLGRIADALNIPLADLYAMADYAAPKQLPSMRPYLRTKYRELPDEAAEQLDAYVQRLAKRHGVDLSGPAPGEDEEPEQRSPSRSRRPAPSSRTKKKGGTR